MEDFDFDAAVAKSVKQATPGLYDAIAALVEAGESRDRIVGAIRRASGRNASLVNNAAITTADYLIARCAVRKRSGGDV